MKKNDRSQLIQDIFSTLELTKRSMFTQFYRSAGTPDLTPSNVRLLFLVSHTEPVQLKALADKLCLTPGAITQTIEVLFRDGYLRRTQDKIDRRGIFVTLTLKGKRKVAGLKKLQQQRFAAMVSTLDDDELRMFLHVQQKMLEHLEHESKGENV